MKLLLLGDIHGNIKWLEAACYYSAQNNCSAILQVGDFGYWPHTKPGIDFLNECVRLWRTYEIPVIFIDGNHENHDMLAEEDIAAHRNIFSPAPQHIDDTAHNHKSLVQIRTGLYWAPRGSMFRINNVNFVGFGGSFSVDRKFRRIHKSWWPQECISEDEVRHFELSYPAQSHCDVLITHDAPIGADMGALLPNGSSTNHPLASAQREFLGRICEVTKPKYLFHGHYHERCSYDVNGILATGLGCDKKVYGEFSSIFDNDSIFDNEDLMQAFNESIYIFDTQNY